MTTSNQPGEALLEAFNRLYPEFKYKPLDTSVDSIRLLILHGAPSQDSALSCSLYHTNFAESPHYEALSYEWGSPASTKPLQIKGARLWLLIGENLHEALVHLRVMEDRTLWIDAICINQDDLAEKQYQVGLMDFIYHRAERVLVWLGRPMPDLIIEDNDERLVHDMNLEMFCTWSWNHTYWSRVWIVQENCSCKEAHSLHWKTLSAMGQIPYYFAEAPFV